MEHVTRVPVLALSEPLISLIDAWYLNQGAADVEADDHMMGHIPDFSLAKGGLNFGEFPPKK